jgi:hypothetical protein
VKLPKTLQKLLSDLKPQPYRGTDVVPDFGVFIDTHRDQPHIGTFHEDIHRGSCRPVMVHLQVEDAEVDPVKLYLVEPTTGKALPIHEKHMFVTPEFWAEFLMTFIMEHGQPPLDSEGVMITSHLRDPRAKVYKLKSFRQMLEWRHEAERSGTYTPKVS